MQFLGKIEQHCMLVLPPRGNPGSATGCHQNNKRLREQSEGNFKKMSNETDSYKQIGSNHP